MLAPHIVQCSLAAAPARHLQLHQFTSQNHGRELLTHTTCVAHQFAHGHKPFVRLVAPLHFGRAVRHIIAHVVQFDHQADGLFGQTAVRGVASCLRCAVSVVAHAFLRLGCFSVFSLWFRAMSDSVYQFVNTTFHNGIGIAQHSVKHSFHGSQYNLG